MEDPNPMQHFQHWFHEVDRTHPEIETNAMLLSTLGLDGFPKSRVVLLKRFIWQGFIFFTNYQSEKGKALASDPKVGLLFDWTVAKRQVHVQGIAKKVARSISEAYFLSRPEGSKLGAWASRQSEVVTSREVLEEQLKAVTSVFENKEIPMPDDWGGYIIEPLQMEFLEKNSTTGITHKTVYTLQKDFCWEMIRLYHR